MTPTHLHEHVDAAAFRAAMRNFTTGVTVVTTAGEGHPSGMTANAFATVSLAPPLVLVCLTATSSTLREIARNGLFAVNVLSAGQEALSRRFASPARARGHAAFADIPHRAAVTGAPIIDGAACWLDCRVTDLHLAGDHVIAIGEVLAVEGEAARDPLVFHAGRYRAVCDALPCGEAPSVVPANPRKEVTRHEDVLCAPARDGEDHRRAVRRDLHDPPDPPRPADPVAPSVTPTP